MISQPVLMLLSWAAATILAVGKIKDAWGAAVVAGALTVTCVIGLAFRRKA